MRLVLILSACVVLQASGASVKYDSKAEKTPFTLEEALFGSYTQLGFTAEWISDTELQYSDPTTKNIVVLDVLTNETSVFLEYSVIAEYKGRGYQISPDRKHVLISYDVLSGFRHSASHKYVLYSIATKKYWDLAQKEFIQIAAWTAQNKLIYVFNNDIYYIGEIGDNFLIDTRLTNTGVPGVIYNGVPDWVYEEEVLLSAVAFWVSPQGDKLVYASFNDTEVPFVTYMQYGEPGNIETNYPKEINIRYPKAGEKNPAISLHLLDLVNNDPQEVPLPSDIDEVITYGVSWMNNDEFSTVVTNRVQNESRFLRCQGQQCTLMMEDKRAGGWAYTALPQFNRDGSKFLRIAPQATDGAGEFNHLTLYTADNMQGKALTKGKLVVTSILGWNEQVETVYFIATEENKPSRRQVYAAFENGTAPICLSCSVLSPEGRPCEWASAKFSTAFSHVILTCSGPDPSVVALYKNRVPLQAPMAVLEGNEELRRKLESKLQPERLDLWVPVPGPFEAQVRLLLPPGADLSGDTKYPLLVFVYAGPDSNQINDAMSIGWPTYLTTNLSIIYGMIDGRGSGLKGNDMLFAGYRSLGTVEIEDQINVTRHLQQQYPFIDAARTAIWGWSYGGYATAKALELDTAGVFSCGISVAPVTNWFYYDSIYTERFMGLPREGDNLAGYLKGDVLHDTENLRNKKYYLIHGNGDDNVHYQQSMLFSRALELKDILFEQQSYPDENHSLGGVTHHLYHSMDRFWRRCFSFSTAAYPGTK